MPATTNEYNRKRDFTKTREPRFKRVRRNLSQQPIFVVQEHHASHLHFDFRLELEGVLKSWAVPKGPSTDPRVKRLAVEVEDHPVGYAKFQGKIPEGQYGAGEVFIWDSGYWQPEGDPQQGLAKGHLEFTLKGEKLSGRWLLIRTARQSGKKNQWLLMKRSEETLAKAKTKIKKSSEFTHPEKILFASEKISKGDVADYYRQVAPLILPHLQDRPLSLLRCPRGTDEKCFVQKHPAEGEEYFRVQSEQDLRELVQLSNIELHTWNCREPDLEKPDQFVLDLDPGPGIPWRQLTDAAFQIKIFLEDLGLQSFVKLSGGKGLHIHVPIATNYTWDDVHGFTKTLAEEMEAEAPTLYTSEMSKSRRAKKIFIDYVRNSRGVTAVAPYSLRAKKVSAVALPLEWDEIEKVASGGFFTLQKALQKIRHRQRDPWQEYLKLRQEVFAL